MKESQRILSAVYIIGMVVWSACQIGQIFPAGVYHWQLPIIMAAILLASWLLGFNSK